MYLYTEYEQICIHKTSFEISPTILLFKEYIYTRELAIEASTFLINPSLYQ